MQVTHVTLTVRLFDVRLNDCSTSESGEVKAQYILICTT